MLKVDLLNTYRIAMMSTHFFIFYWTVQLWGARLKSFLYLTKINFFLNFFYFLYTALIFPLIKYLNKKKIDEENKLINSIYKFSFSLSITVNVLYWSITFFSKGLLGNSNTPIILDLFLHGGNLVTLIVDSILNQEFNKNNHFLTNMFYIKFTVFYFLLQYFV